MIRLRRYNDSVRAQAAAAFLRDNEINATVVGEHVHSVFPGIRFFSVDLMIPDNTDRDEAERVLQEFDTEPLEVEEGWEQAAVPDLSKLTDPSVDIDCPNCRINLPLDAGLDLCPSCRQPVDVAALIAHKYGPDVLAPCFEDESVMGFALQGRGAPCEFCGYNLIGLATRGRCPECGSLYDAGGTGPENNA